MRKLAPARVSYRDDLSISYRVYVMTDDYITFTGADLGGGCRGWGGGGGGPPPPPPPPEMTYGFLITNGKKICGLLVSK